jgi:ribose 5-phosphate isomerase A
MTISTIANEKKLAADEAVKLIRNGQVVGLGTGSTAYYAIMAIGEMVKQGLSITAVPTSQQTKILAASLHIPLVDINTITAIDITIDGADEFTSDLMLIKGGGGALLREKIVASITKQEIIIADASKKVDVLGKFKVPLEVIPFAASYVLNQLLLKQGYGKIRMVGGTPYITDQGNYIIDADFGMIANPRLLAEELNTITGIVEHGLFINLAAMVIMGKGNAVITYLSK